MSGFGCGFDCWYALAIHGFQFVEIEGPSRENAFATWPYENSSRLVSEPGIYRARIEAANHPDCDLFEEFALKRPHDNYVESLALKNKCIAISPISRFSAKYELREQIETVFWHRVIHEVQRQQKGIWDRETDELLAATTRYIMIAGRRHGQGPANMCPVVKCVWSVPPTGRRTSFIPLATVRSNSAAPSPAFKKCNLPIGGPRPADDCPIAPARDSR